MTNKTLTYNELLIYASEVYEQMGYRDALPDEVTQQEVRRIVEEVCPLVKPQFCFFVTRTLPPFEMASCTVLRPTLCLSVRQVWSSSSISSS